MKMKKIVAAMLTVTCLLGNGTAVFAQTEDNYTELPQQVIDIANGSDDIYGPGRTDFSRGKSECKVRKRWDRSYSSVYRCVRLGHFK